MKQRAAALVRALLAGCMLVAVAGVLSAAPPKTPVNKTDEALVFFKNGRALRVLDHRTEGNWVYLTVSQPPPQQGEDEEDLVNEIGVLASSIDRIERASGAPRAAAPVTSGGRVANGMVSDPSRYDSAANRGYVVENSTHHAARKIENTPAMGDPAAAKYRGQSTIPEIKDGTNVAGQIYRVPLSRVRVPQNIMERARILNEQRRQQRLANQQQQQQPQQPQPQQPQPQQPQQPQPQPQQPPETGSTPEDAASGAPAPGGGSGGTDR